MSMDENIHYTFFWSAWHSWRCTHQQLSLSSLKFCRSTNRRSVACHMTYCWINLRSCVLKPCRTPVFCLVFNNQSAQNSGVLSVFQIWTCPFCVFCVIKTPVNNVVLFLLICYTRLLKHLSVSRKSVIIQDTKSVDATCFKFLCSIFKLSAQPRVRIL